MPNGQNNGAGSTDNSEILINRIFNGDYAKDPDTIAHENINLIRADNLSHYVYIVDSGAIAKTHNDKISTVLLARSNGDTSIEIIGKLSGLKQIVKVRNSLDKDLKRIGEEQADIATNIQYDGISVDRIFALNNYSSKYDAYPIYATFKADTLIKPAAPIFLADDANRFAGNNQVIILNSKLAKRSQTQFFKSGTSDYNTLLNLINDASKWERTDSSAPIDVSTINDHFLTIIRKENIEVIYSNLLQHFFLSNKRRFIQFASQVLHVNLANDFTIKREVKTENGKYIDLLIQDRNNIIVIENKIKSKINGVERHNVYSDEVQSQLSHYYDYCVANANGRTIKCFLLSPDYNHIDLTNYATADYYVCICYSALYDFFRNNQSNEKYYDDLLYALSIQSTKVDESLQRDVFRRFVNRIRELK